MNIWIVNHYAIPPSMGGLVRHYYFSKYLQQRGHKIKIFTSSKIHNTDINIIKDNSLYSEEIVDDIKYTFVKSRDYKGNGLDRIFNLMDFPFKVWGTMKRFMKQDKPDVIYTSSPDLFVAFFALLFGRKHKIPVVTEVRDLWPESIVEYKHMTKKNIIIKVLYQLEKWIYINSDELIFTMKGGQEYIKEKKWDKSIELTHVNYVNNGVDLEEYERNLAQFQLADDDLDRNDTFKVIYIGSIRNVNNLNSLIEAARVLKSDERIVILIYGDGTEKNELERKCEREGLNVKFKGKIEKKYIPFILSRSDLNVINVKAARINKYGCSWNKLFEYMASGKPILCNLSVEYDLIKEFHLGVAKRFENSEEYAENIRRFSELNDKEYLEYCNNSANCVKRFDYKILSEKVEEILRRVCNKTI